MLCTVSNHSFETCLCCRAGRYEVDGYVYNSAEEPKILMTGKWNESMNYQPCDSEGEPLPNTELQEVKLFLFQGDNKEFLSVGLYVANTTILAVFAARLLICHFLKYSCFSPFSAHES